MDSRLLQKVMNDKMQTIKRYLIKIGAHPMDAEDIVQEALYKFLLYIEAVEPEKASSWLFRVSLNKYYDLCRKQKRKVTVELNQLDLVDHHPLPEDQLTQNEMRLEINSTLNKLKPIYKHLIVLKYELELSYEEIGQLLDIKLGTLKTYLFRAREQFKDMYEKEVKDVEGQER